VVLGRYRLKQGPKYVMGDMWRSQEMQLVQLIVQNDAAHSVVTKLGELGNVEFRDLNSGTSIHKRSFVEEVRTCDEIERVLRAIFDEIQAAGISVTDPVKSDATPLDILSVKVMDADTELSSLKASQDLLKKNHNALIEQQYVLTMGKKIYCKANPTGASTGVDKMQQQLMALSEFTSDARSLLSQVSGLIKSDQVAALERVIFRATRGNAVFQSVAIDQPLLDTEAKGTPEPVSKTFFMVLFAGEVLKDKVSKICSYFGGSLYKYPTLDNEHREMSAEVERRIVESGEILARGNNVLSELLTNFSNVFGTWQYVVSKEKMVFDALNMCEFDIKRHVFIAEGWVPKREYESLVSKLQEATVECGLDTRPVINRLESQLTPPTYIPVNKFTSGFQALVNTYGTPRYREANPGAFCCIMFPFLFGIMFGDFGHGLLLACFGYWLTSKEKAWQGKSLNDMVAMCFGGRYVIMLNGIFGLYVGLLYNECFAFPMNFFGGTRWMNSDDTSVSCNTESEGSCVMVDGPYPLGIDPIWHVTANKITFFNSFKMKISIIVGVIQMSVGIFLSLLNHIEYRDIKRIFFQFIPEIVFFEGIFGYLVYTIFLKWSVNWTDPADPRVAPSLLTLLINMFMSPTSDINEPLYGSQCFVDCSAASDHCGVASIQNYCPETCGLSGKDLLHPMDNQGIETKICYSSSQASIQFGLLIAAFVAVPFLLLPIPFIELYQHKQATKYAALHEDDEKAEAHSGDHEGEFSFGDAFIHQAIHTIEFVLGSISNTASYLRLWALSLAHSQLAELFKDMILVDAGLNASGMNPIVQGIVIFLSYAMWAIISMVVLMVMENLSSFLHALRLQWVEFQNKFFYGDGQKYTPFAFTTINADTGDD